MKILFVGNSFTARNDVPGMIASLAAAAGHALEPALISAGGASLRRHWNRGEAVAAIGRASWDWVVLQEQSTLPVKNPARMRENVGLFAPAVAASGARLALYVTWARRSAPDAQALIDRAYADAAADTGATLVPVGSAWRTFLGRHDAPALHDRDLSHPTLAGSFLAACVFFGVLWERSPEGLPAPAALGDAAALQGVAWETVRGDIPRHN